MTSKFLGIVLLVLITCTVCSIGSEYSIKNHHYNSEKLFPYEITSFDATKNSNKFMDEETLLDEFQSFTAENLLPLLIGIQGNNDTNKCFNDSYYILNNTQSEWSQKMLDSFGKPERGIIKGNLHWMGDFDECLSVYAPAEANSTIGDFHGRYCNLLMTVNIFGQSIPIKIGSCIPDSCDSSVETINDILNVTSKTLLSQFNVTDVTLTCDPVIGKLTPAAIFFISLLSIFVLVALIGSLITAYKYFSEMDTCIDSGSEHKRSLTVNEEVDIQLGDADIRERSERLDIFIEKVNPFFNCFCLFTNGAKLLDTSSSEGQLPCLHGIRFLSLSWVIICHTYAFGSRLIRELGTILPAMDHWPYQILMNGFVSVDSFFLLSGFLLAYLFFQGASKTNGKIPWLYFYVHRYVRITPVYMLVLAFYTTIYPYLSSGPLWNAKEPELCAKIWWKNILYIGNLYDTACLGWSWYLSNDMQFFVISPLFLITLWRFPPVGISITALFLVATSVANFVISYQYNLPPGLGDVFEKADPIKFINGDWEDYTIMIYTKPYTRIGPYLVGIALGYYLYRRKQNNSSKNSLVVLSAGWFIASTVTLACLFGLYRRDMSVVEASFYTAFNRTCFASGLAWVIYVCITDQGGFINSILSFKLFIPLSRLTYCAYLVHPVIMYFYLNSMRSLMDFSHLNMFTLYLGFLVISYGVAFITSLLFESPIIRLEKIVRSKFGAK